MRDAISAKEYEPLCSKLIGQYKTLYESLRDQVSRVYLANHVLSAAQIFTPVCNTSITDDESRTLNSFLQDACLAGKITCA